MRLNRRRCGGRDAPWSVARYLHTVFSSRCTWLRFFPKERPLCCLKNSRFSSNGGRWQRGGTKLAIFERCTLLLLLLSRRAFPSMRYWCTFSIIQIFCTFFSLWEKKGISQARALCFFWKCWPCEEWSNGWDWAWWRFVSDSNQALSLGSFVSNKSVDICSIIIVFGVWLWCESFFCRLFFFFLQFLCCLSRLWSFLLLFLVQVNWSLCTVRSNHRS